MCRLTNEQRHTIASVASKLLLTGVSLLTAWLTYNQKRTESRELAFLLAGFAVAFFCTVFTALKSRGLTIMTCVAFLFVVGGLIGLFVQPEPTGDARTGPWAWVLFTLSLGGTVLVTAHALLWDARIREAKERCPLHGEAKCLEHIAGQSESTHPASGPPLKGAGPLPPAGSTVPAAQGSTTAAVHQPDPTSVPQPAPTAPVPPVVAAPSPPPPRES